MKLSFMTMVALILVTISLNAGNLTILESSDSSLRLQFKNNLTTTANHADKASQEQSFSEAILNNNYNLPMIQCMIQIPNNHKPVVSIVNPSYSFQNNVKYSKIDKEIIVSDDIVLVSAPFIMRNNLLSTLSIQPYQYDDLSSQLKVMEEAEIIIDFIPDPQYKTVVEIKQSREFKSWLSQSVINYRENTRFGDAMGSLLIIYNQTASPLSNIQPLIDWKRQKGWIVNSASTIVTGTSNTAIQNYIQNAYNTWDNPPEYILLLGKTIQTNYVATFTINYSYNTAGDYKYTLLEGNDIIPDAYIGRLTFSSTAQLTSMINKIIAYEKMQGLSTNNWYNSGLLVSDETDSGPSCTTNIDYVRDLMIEYNPLSSISYALAVVSPPTNIPPQTYSALNQGVSNFYYRGHNGYSGITNTDISNLLNTGKYPFISMITCFSGNFGQQSQLSIGEQFMRVGTSSNPKGGIGFIGSSCETHTCLNNIMTGAIAYGFYKEGLTNQGQVLLRAKLGLLASYPQNPDDYIPQNFQSLNLIGDPTIDIWLRQPTAISVQHSGNASISNGFLRVQVTDTNGNPVNQAKVCLLKGTEEVFLVGYTNSSGVYNFAWSSATTGSAILTVTKANHMTYQGTVEFLGESNHFSINNLAAFNQSNSGTFNSFALSLTNNHYPILYNVTANLSSTSEFVSIRSGSVPFGNMIQNQTLASLANIEYSISKLCPHNEDLEFTITVSGIYEEERITYNICFQTKENGSNIVVTGYQFGGDNFLSPGEMSDFYIKLSNTSTVTATGVSATITCLNPNVNIIQNTQSFNNIQSGSTILNAFPFTIEANQSVYNGSVIVITADVSYNNGASQLLTFSITIGSSSQTDMTGPDDYGYICIANTDNHVLARPYNWIEINPSLGGSGTLITLTDNNNNGSGSWSTVSLPFNFKYYGRVYSQLSICSNGFIMPGSQGSQEWMNWSLPGPMAPRPILAPFWDDLIIQSDSRIIYYYDNVNNRFIVEWYKLKNKYNINSHETFQVIIYNDEANITPTGDNAFLFQYMTFNNVDAGNYGGAMVDHGQYATVGIGDHSGTAGITYTYQNLYPQTTSILTNESTLYFSTMLNLNYLPNLSLDSFQFNELIPVFSNNQIDCGETIAITPIISNTGTAVLDSAIVTITTNDEYVIILTNNSSINSIGINDNSAVNVPFQVRISNDCPNLREIQFTLHLLSNGISYSLSFNITVNSPHVGFSSFLINGSQPINLEPGISVPASMLIVNYSNIAFQDAMFSFQNNQGWVATPNLIQFDLPPMGSINFNFHLQTTEATTLGEEITISGLFSIAGIYEKTFIVNLIAGQMDLIFTNDFNTNPNLQNWVFSPEANVVPASFISNTGNELSINPNGSSLNCFAVSPLISAYDSQLMQISFKYINYNATSQNRLLIAYNNSEEWQSIYSFNEQQLQTINASVLVNDLPADITSIKLKMQFTLSAADTGRIFIDDIMVKSIHHPVGHICGNVHLDNLIQNVTQVKIYTSAYPDVFVYPDASGSYSLPLYQGTYPIIKAEIPMYLSQTLHNVQVISGQNTQNVDFSLSYMRKPANVSYSITENLLGLEWQLEPLADMSFARIEPDYYRIYITHNNVTNEDTTSYQHYGRTIEFGVYNIYIKSVYLHEGIECYSDTSNVLTFNFTSDNDNNQIPWTFALEQNYPNPFNPKTMISYSLKQPGRTVLNIFNVKGEIVRTLVNESQKSGNYQVEFDGLDAKHKALASGFYFYKLTSGNNTVTKKMVLLK